MVYADLDVASEHYQTKKKPKSKPVTPSCDVEYSLVEYSLNVCYEDTQLEGQQKRGVLALYPGPSYKASGVYANNIVLYALAFKPYICARDFIVTINRELYPFCIKVECMSMTCLKPQ